LGQLEESLIDYIEVLDIAIRTKKEKKILKFVVVYDIMVANTLFRKKKFYLVTLNSDQHSNQINFVLTRREERPNCIDRKVISDEYVIP
jgi:hypothetical protein